MRDIPSGVYTCMTLILIHRTHTHIHLRSNLLYEYKGSEVILLLFIFNFITYDMLFIYPIPLYILFAIGLYSPTLVPPLPRSSGDMWLTTSFLLWFYFLDFLVLHREGYILLGYGPSQNKGSSTPLLLLYFAFWHSWIYIHNYIFMFLYFNVYIYSDILCDGVVRESDFVPKSDS